VFQVLYLRKACYKYVAYKVSHLLILCFKSVCNSDKLPMNERQLLNTHAMELFDSGISSCRMETVCQLLHIYLMIFELEFL